MPSILCCFSFFCSRKSSDVVFRNNVAHNCGNQFCRSVHLRVCNYVKSAALYLIVKTNTQLLDICDQSHRRRSSVNVGRQDVAGKYNVWKNNKMPKFYMIFAPKSNKMSKCNMNVCPENIFFLNLRCKCPPTTRLLCLWSKLNGYWLETIAC